MLRFLKKIPLHIMFIIASFAALIPFYYMIVTAFKTEIDYYGNRFGLPTSWTIENFVELIINRRFYLFFTNTVIITFMSTTFAIIITILASYAYAKMKFKGSDTLFSITIALTAMSPIIVVVPLFRAFSILKLTNTFHGVSIVYIGFMLPLAIFILTSFFKTIPDEILDAAKIDGCGWLGILLRIMIPLSKPPLITLFIINGLWVWNEFLIGLVFLQDRSKRTLVVEMGTFIGKFRSFPTLIMTAALFVGLPMMILYVVGQKYFVKGLTAGTLK